MRTVLLLVLGIVWSACAWAQADTARPGAAPAPAVATETPACDSLQVRYIVLTGNRITKRHIVLRELEYAEGSRLAVRDTANLFGQGRNRIFNTRLFVTVSQHTVPLAPAQAGCPQPVLVEIVLRERFYLFPFPILELADRSINEWIYNQGANIRRINYGLRVEANNLRGRNETLKVIGQWGFTRKLEASYQFPYLTRRLKEGLYLQAQYVTNRQIAAKSEGNRQFFIQNPAFGPYYERVRGGAEFSYRPLYWITQRIGLSYTWHRINDSIARRAPEYFLDSATSQRYFQLRYSFTYDRRDIRQYPLKGFFTGFALERFGLLPTDQVSLWSASAEASQFTRLGGPWFLANGASTTLSTPARQPYAQTRILGFGQNYVRGYERYVLEGPVNVVVKNTLRYRLFQQTVRVPGVPFPQFSVIPIAVYLKTYADAGYVRNPLARPENARLLNTWLFGTGLGLDLVTFYDYLLRFEYSLNRQGEHGLFFNVAVEI